MKALILAALLGIATVGSAQVSSTVMGPSACYPPPSQIECVISVENNLLDPVGVLLIVFPSTAAPNNQGSLGAFSVYEWYGPGQLTSFQYIPKVAWGYAGGIYTAAWTSPTGRVFLIDWRSIATARYGTAWVVLDSSRITGPSMLLK